VNDVYCCGGPILAATMTACPGFVTRGALDWRVMKRPRSRRLTPTAIALYLNAALLAAILLVMMGRNGIPDVLPAAMAQNQPPIAGGAGFFVMPAQFAEKIWGCYLLDVDTQTLCAYQYFQGEKQLRLVAARNFRSDRRLSNFNTDNPTPEEVAELVAKEQAADRVLNSNNEAAPESPESSPQE